MVLERNNMAIFNFKKKKIVLQCFANSQHLAEYVPIQMASSFYPNWWKELPKAVVSPGKLGGTGTMKTCVGFIKHFENSAIIPMWSDLIVGIGHQAAHYQYHFSDGVSEATHHPEYQYNNYFSGNQYQHLKLISPWLLYCDEPVNFMWTEPVWHTNFADQYRVLPGTIDFRYQHATNVNMILTRGTTDRKITIPFKQPIAHIVPLSDRDLHIEVIYDRNKWQDIAQSGFFAPTFIGKYFSIRRAHSELKNKQSKCPFGFGKK